MALIPLKNLLPQALKKNKISAQVEASLVLEEFEKAAVKKWGEKIRNEAKAMYLKNKILYVAVLSSVVASELKMHTNYLITLINETTGNETVKDIRLLM